ncbi:ATP-dependent DNA ligase [Tabrizicola piscis]|uniref:DNA ligase (ATP) n=1 Tax=Tabrizicola piscis TaxID=2494374 RepID=A0A3S8U377_9RHOB|nr:ATP-dependent DNA ligase [Tabrizicola piscis]AZL58057.1 ATP-dependent DNA ligase [Tabrizicola piscis]
MHRFAALFAALDGTTKTGLKTAALADYFRAAPEADRVWTVALLTGRRPRRAVNSTELRLWAAEAADIPDWLFEESYTVVGDLAETIALLLPPPEITTGITLDETIRGQIRLTGQPVEVRRAAVLSAWSQLPATERFLYNKLLTGGFRMGVAQGLLTRALAQATGVEEATLAHRLMGNWDPAHTPFAALIEGNAGGDARPYPFALASQLEDGPDSLGPPQDWLAEWKWDGIRGQLIARPGAFALWSRGEELITDRFPELAALADFLPPGTVIDGEIVAWDSPANQPLPFAALQKRIGRKTVPKALLASAPARMLAYDLLEDGGTDIRDRPFAQRRARLEAILAALPPGLPLAASPVVAFDTWESLTRTRATAREREAEGVMLKRALSPYFTGRKRGDWWKWKLDPYTVDAVMLYAQAGHGRRANLFTDFTFGIRDGNELVPFTKAYSGLTDAEFSEITRWVQSHTLERFGPVRKVPAELVFEIGFEGIQASPRHKSGIALRFPRMLRWRRDKPVNEIDTLDSLRALLRAAG